MVTFICQHCDTTLKKKQVDKHAFGRCRPPAFICIDCHITFRGQDYKAHINCLTEFQKHWGQYAKPKHITNSTQNNHQQAHNGISTSKAKLNNNSDKRLSQLFENQEIQDKFTALNAAQKQIVKPQEQNIIKKEQVKDVCQWKGWKTQLKQIIKQNKNEIELQRLKKKAIKRYKKFDDNEDMQDEQLNKLIQSKLNKLKKVKLVTYVKLQ